MKDKNLAGILALFLGMFGVHRFYLGQIGLGILYAMFFWISWLFGLIDAIVFFSMDKDHFDIKYNKQFYKAVRKNENARRSREERRERRSNSTRREANLRNQRPRTEIPVDRTVARKHNPYKQTGIRKFRDFDYQGAIEDFEKALEFDPKDIAVHFNLACAYSLDENAEKSFYHLDQAVNFGFNAFEKIKEHDALAFIRVQPTFEAFEANGYRLQQQIEAPKEEPENLLNTEVPRSDDLLQQLRKLGELREKGLLSQEEFEKQKKKLLRRGD